MCYFFISEVVFIKMPSRQEKKRAKRRAKYLEVRDDVLESARASYKADPEKKRTGERERYHADPVKKRSAKRKSYDADPEKKRSAKRESYENGEAAIQQSLGVIKKLRKQVNKNILYEKVGGI